MTTNNNCASLSNAFCKDGTFEYMYTPECLPFMGGDCILKDDLQVFVAFDDGESPTWAHVSNAYLCVGSEKEENPCRKPLKWAPLRPTNHKEMIALCDIMGLSYDYDNDGQLIIYTGFSRLETGWGGGFGLV